MDLICEAAKCLATLYHLLIILSAVQKLFGVKDSQIFFFFFNLQAYEMNVQTWVCESGNMSVEVAVWARL